MLTLKMTLRRWGSLPGCQETKKSTPVGQNQNSPGRILTRRGSCALADLASKQKRLLFEIGRALVYVMAPVTFVAVVMIPGVPEWAVRKVRSD